MALVLQKLKTQNLDVRVSGNVLFEKPIKISELLTAQPYDSVILNDIVISIEIDFSLDTSTNKAKFSILADPNLIKLLGETRILNQNSFVIIEYLTNKVNNLLPLSVPLFYGVIRNISYNKTIDVEVEDYYYALKLIQIRSGKYNNLTLLKLLISEKIFNSVIGKDELYFKYLVFNKELIDFLMFIIEKIRQVNTLEILESELPPDTNEYVIIQDGFTLADLFEVLSNIYSKYQLNFIKNIPYFVGGILKINNQANTNLLTLDSTYGSTFDTLINSGSISYPYILPIIIRQVSVKDWGLSAKYVDENQKIYNVSYTTKFNANKEVDPSKNGTNGTINVRFYLDIKSGLITNQSYFVSKDNPITDTLYQAVGDVKNLTLPSVGKLTKFNDIVNYIIDNFKVQAEKFIKQFNYNGVQGTITINRPTIPTYLTIKNKIDNVPVDYIFVGQLIVIIDNIFDLPVINKSLIDNKQGAIYFNAQNMSGVYWVKTNKINITNNGELSQQITPHFRISKEQMDYLIKQVDATTFPSGDFDRNDVYKTKLKEYLLILRYVNYK